MVVGPRPGAAGGRRRATRSRSAPTARVPVEIDTAVAKADPRRPGPPVRRSRPRSSIESRRTIVGTGNVLVARKPFQVFAWVDRGHYRVGDTIERRLQRPDARPQAGRGQGQARRCCKITYDDEGKPVETAVQTWKLDTDAEGQARSRSRRAEAGQYRLSYKVTDGKKHTIEGGYLFAVARRGLRRRRLPLQRPRAHRRQARIRARAKRSSCMVNTNRAGGAVLLFVRPANGVYLPPKVSSTAQGQERSMEEIAVVAEGHAELLRRGADGRRRQGPHRDARDRRAAGEARPQRRGAAVAARSTSRGRRRRSRSS